MPQCPIGVICWFTQSVNKSLEPLIGGRHRFRSWEYSTEQDSHILCWHVTQSHEACIFLAPNAGINQEFEFNREVSKRKLSRNSCWPRETMDGDRVLPGSVTLPSMPSSSCRDLANSGVLEPACQASCSSSQARVQ